MDSAHYASMSDPDANPHFRRRWNEPPLPPQCDDRKRTKTLEEIAAEVAVAWRREAPRRLA